MSSQSASWNYRQQIVTFLESTKNRTYTIVGLTLLSLIFFGAFAIKPTISTIFKLQNKIEDGRIIEEKMQTKINTLTKLQQNIYKYEREINLLKESFSTKPKIDIIIANVQLIAEEYDLKVLSINPSDKEDSYSNEDVYVDVSAQSMNISLSGDKRDLQNFIQHFENLPRTVYVERIRFQSIENEEDETLNTTIYFFYNQ